MALRLFQAEVFRKHVYLKTVYLTEHYVLDNKSNMFIYFYSFIFLSTFYLVFFFPLFPLNYLYVSLSSFYSFPSSPLPLTLYHIHVQPTCFCLFSFLYPA
jgi:hypothetical protein